MTNIYYLRKPCKRCSLPYAPETRGNSPYCNECKAARLIKVKKEKKPKKAGPGWMKPDIEKRHAMAALFSQGHTLQEIGDKYGVCRERVRQLIGRFGLTRKDGGSYVVGVAKETERKKKLAAAFDKRAMKLYGCPRKQAIELNDGMPLRKIGTLAERFLNQKHCAINVRDISWEMTFPQWVQVWKDSGKLSERGLWSAGYCMARKGDVGPYAVGNVYITTLASNSADYQAELKIRGVVCPDGYRRLPERAEKLFGISVSR